MHQKNRIVRVSSLFLLGFLQFQFILGQVDIPMGSSFRYLKGKDATSLSSDWMNQGFDDSSWSVGSAPFWYGDGSGGMNLDDMQNSYSVLYMRSAFSVLKADSLGELLVLTDYDDGFVIWINGRRVLSRFAPAVLSNDALAPELHESGVVENFIIDPEDSSVLSVAPLCGVERYMAWLSNSFLLDIEDPALLAKHFEWTHRISSTVPTFTLDYPRDYGMLAKVRNLVQQHISNHEK